MPRVKVPNPFTKYSKSWTINPSIQDERSTWSKKSSLDDDDVSNWEKLKLLLWKNYKIQVRHKVQTVVEILVPILFTIILVAVRCTVESNVVTKPTVFRPFDVNDIPTTPRECCQQIYYAPKNELTEKVMLQVQQDFFNLTDFNYSFLGFADEKDLELNYAKSTTAEKSSSDDESDEGRLGTVLAGIVFTNEFPYGQFPKEIKYKIRFPAAPRAEFDFLEERFGFKNIWFSEILYPVVQILGPRAIGQLTGGVPGYFNEGFLYLQYAVEKTVSEWVLKDEGAFDPYEVKLQRFPYPGFIDDKFLFTLQGILPLTLILSFIFPVLCVTKLVVVEKERRLKEYMKMMGLPNWLHWTAWFIKSFLFLAITAFLMTILLKIRVMESQILAILPNSDPTLIYFCIISHIFQLICFAFFVSTLFKTANSAAIVAAILWFIFFIPFAFIQPRYNILSRPIKVLWSVGTNLGISFCCQLFCMFEGTGKGAQWSTVFQGVTPDDTFSLADCILVMFANSLFYLLLAIYTEAVWPGEFGIPLPWYFPFTRWYWTGETRQKYIQDDDGKHAIPQRNLRKDLFEDVHANLVPGIEIKGLTKKFGDTKIAVRNLHLNLYKNEIFVLLGHNAAGKTTTMSILAGIFPPTSGTALINGYDICTDMKSVRQSLGLCPQTNVLFAELTVEEHLYFFSTLKGLKKSEVKPEVNRMIKAIGLQDKRDTLADDLSGGMKRRLSVGIAFCADSKVVLLDEPSSGLDPGARRGIWDLIQSEKRHRTILLSTHYMDEADILGDRIAIMAEGEVQCCGSSLFLKKKYGCGYHLVIVKEPTCNVNNITNLLKSRLEDVEEEQNVGAELSYALPDNQSHLFAAVFEELEKRKSEFGIASYGASITTMEEVFMRVGQLLDNQREGSEASAKGVSKGTNGNRIEVPKGPTAGTSPKIQKEGRVQQVALDLDPNIVDEAEMNLDQIKNTGLTLRYQQFRAMISKKLVFTTRKYGLLLGTIAIPTIYLSLVSLVLKTVPGFHDAPPRPMILDDYELFGKTVTTLRCPKSGGAIASSICQGYVGHLKILDKNYQFVPDNLTFVDEILNQAELDLPFVNTKYMIGYDERPQNGTNKTELIGFFNNQPLHTPPLALNFLTNAILRGHESGNVDLSTGNYSIQVTSHPFEFGTAHLQDVGSYFTVGFQIGLHLSIAIGFMMGIYIVFPIKERMSGSKHLQFVSGVNFLIFWLANFLADLIAFALPCLAIHLILFLYQIEDFYSFHVQSYLLILFYSFAFAILPLLYVGSLFFRISSSGLVGMGVFNVFTGFASLFVVSILENPELKQEELATTLHRTFLAIPSYALGKGIVQISKNHQLQKACSSINLEFFCDAFPDSLCCAQLKSNYLDWEESGIGRNIIYLLIFGLITWTVLLVFESGILQSLFGRFSQKIENLSVFKMPENNNQEDFDNTAHTVEDEDVHSERLRIQNTSLEGLNKTDNLIIRDLTKRYSGDYLAVDRISLGVKKGECFGLLGANGAGKTSTFKMLTGELPVTSGDGHIYGHCIRTEIKEAHRNMGYCPQFDSLIEEMTGRETLQMYARLRGIPEGLIDRMIFNLAEQLLLTEFLDKVSKSYSGGNKRKLSTAIALMGNPPLVFLDEPTCGIDPVARRHLWECITRIRDAGTSVILTSHSMEETEFLCTRLAIMVNGKFRCLGSPQQLKSKFGEGYTLTAQTQVNESEVTAETSSNKGTWGSKARKRALSRSQSIDPTWRHKLAGLRQFIEESLPGCSLEDMHQGFLHYRVESDKATWGQMFTVMEVAKEKFGVEAYSVGQTSLEQVFLNFVKAQVNADNLLS